MKHAQDKIKIGNVELDEDEFAPKNQKHRVTTFIDGDVLDLLKAEALKLNIGYQTLLNLKLRASMTAPTVKEEFKSAVEELFADGKLVITNNHGTISKGKKRKGA